MCIPLLKTNYKLENHISSIQKAFIDGGEGNAATNEILQGSLRDTTLCKYDRYIKQSTKFYNYLINIGHVLDFFLSNIFC